MNLQHGIEVAEPIDFRQFEREGFQVIANFVSDAGCDRLCAELTPLFERELHSGNSRIGGVRNLLHSSPVVSEFAKTLPLTSILQRAVGATVFPVRAIFFDKTPDTNWVVPWHQDLAIAVTKQIEADGFSGWSIKDGSLHVHPPAEILESMVTFRLHLDDCCENNGPLKVIPGSHCSGKISASEIAQRATEKTVLCEVKKGGVLLMRPLLLHSSARAENPHHRRVLHIEYAAQQLPNGLEWLDN